MSDFPCFKGFFYCERYGRKPVALLSTAGGSFLIPSYAERGKQRYLQNPLLTQKPGFRAHHLAALLCMSETDYAPSPGMGFRTNWRSSRAQKKTEKKYNYNFLNITPFTCRCCQMVDIYMFLLWLQIMLQGWHTYLAVCMSSLMRQFYKGISNYLIFIDKYIFAINISAKVKS